MTLKSRSFSVTVHVAHVLYPKVPAPSADSDTPQASTPEADLQKEPAHLAQGEGQKEDEQSGMNAFLEQTGEHFDNGVIDYAIISLEESSKGVPHLQGFFVFNEAALEKGKKPTDYLNGHWTKARSLSGARDYCAAVGIHIKKPGLYGVVEYGQWVDPGWNQNLRSRLIYQMAAEIEHGSTYANLCVEMPAAVLLVGTHNLSSLEEMRAHYMPTSSSKVGRSLATSPYCYIGRTFLLEDFLKSEKTLLFLELAEAVQSSLEEE